MKTRITETLRTFVRSVLNEDTCPCGIERADCDYHKPQSSIERDIDDSPSVRKEISWDDFADKNPEAFKALHDKYWRSDSWYDFEFFDNGGVLETDGSRPDGYPRKLRWSPTKGKWFKR